MRILLLSYLLLFVNCAGYTQQEVLSDSIISPNLIKENSGVLIGVTYLNDWVYMGRKDSLPNPYLQPFVEYSHTSGIFFNTSISYLTRKEVNRIDLISMMLGYDYLNRNVSAGIAISGYLYNEESYNVQSHMYYYSSLYFSYDFHLIEAQISGGIGLSDATDGFMSAELFRVFYPARNVELRPSFLVSWGTQNYYNEYYRESSTSHGIRKGKGGQRSSSTGRNPLVTVEEVSVFRCLAYELPIFFAYKFNRVKLFLQGSFIVPQNPATITIDQAGIEEPLENSIFWSAGFSYRL